MNIPILDIRLIIRDMLDLHCKLIVCPVVIDYQVKQFNSKPDNKNSYDEIYYFYRKRFHIS